jgi:hypothetical protein
LRSVVAGGAVLLLVAGLAGHAARESTAGDAEVRRVQAHLARVSRELAADPRPGLSPEQRVARRSALRWLDQYRDTGVFPHNHVRAGRVPVFVDPHGTPCAVGYLMLRSGEDALVERIVRSDNLVRVHELRDDPEVSAWLDSHGLTLDEAARIQPTYGERPPPDLTSPSPYRDWTVGFSVATAALTSYAVMAGLDRGSPWVDALTVGTAIGQVALLAGGAAERDPEDWAVGLNVVGALVNVGLEALRVSTRGGSNDQQAAAVEPFVTQGARGTELGLAFRH